MGVSELRYTKGAKMATRNHTFTYRDRERETVRVRERKMKVKRLNE